MPVARAKTESGLEKIVLSLPKYDSTAELYLYGATVTSWTCHGRELLFLSKKALLDGSKAIRGGIPLVFPLFGSSKESALPQHGFGRLSTFEFEGINVDSQNEVSVSLSLKPSNVLPQLLEKWGWSGDFKLVYTVSLKDGALQTNMMVKNLDAEREMKFHFLLHTYLAAHLETTVIAPLGGLDYTDKVVPGLHKSTSDTLTIKGEVDRVYIDAPSVVRLESDHSSVEVHKHDLRDVVVWNCGPELNLKMADMHEEAYKEYVCIEAGSVNEYVTLKAKGTWEGGQTLQLKN